MWDGSVTLTPTSEGEPAGGVNRDTRRSWIPHVPHGVNRPSAVP